MKIRKLIIIFLSFSLCSIMILPSFITTAVAVEPRACVGADCPDGYAYSFSGARAQMRFKNVDANADVGWFLGVKTTYSNGKFTTPSFAIIQQDVTVWTNLGVSNKYLVLDHVEYSTNKNKMYIVCYYFVRAEINGNVHDTYLYTEGFTLVA